MTCAFFLILLLSDCTWKMLGMSEKFTVFSCFHCLTTSCIVLFPCCCWVYYCSFSISRWLCNWHYSCCYYYCCNCYCRKTWSVYRLSDFFFFIWVFLPAAKSIADVLLFLLCFCCNCKQFCWVLLRFFRFFLSLMENKNFRIFCTAPLSQFRSYCYWCCCCCCGVADGFRCSC